MKTKHFFTGLGVMFLMTAVALLWPGNLMALDEGNMREQHQMSGPRMDDRNMMDVDNQMSKDEGNMREQHQMSGPRMDDRNMMDADNQMSKKDMMGKPTAVKHDAPIYVSPIALQKIQEKLSQQNFNAGPSDGIWGSKTASGIKRFQKEQDLAATGNLNIETIQALGLTDILQGKIEDTGQMAKSTNTGKSAQLYLSPNNLRQVQQSLRDEGFEVGRVDGIWGDRTRKAIQSFQKKSGMESSGHITLGMLNRLGVGEINTALKLNPDLFEEESSYAGVSDTEYRQRLETAGMDVKTTSGRQKEMADKSDRQQKQMSQNDNMDRQRDDEMPGYAGVTNEDRKGRLEAAGMDVKSATVKKGEQHSQVARGYYEKDGMKAIKGQGAPLFAGSKLIRQVQQALDNKGYDPGKIDGKWGSSTKNALSRYQKKENLYPTGSLTLSTLNKLVNKNMMQ